MKINKTKILLILITLTGLVIRTVNLANNPPHLTSDEAAIGYNAYSILKTGKDEYGERLPIIFKSFGDYKPGLYIYLTVPFVALLDLNELSVRLPSALMGTLSILLIYSLTLIVSGKKRTALLAAALLAISPWHIHFSRGAWEISMSLTLSLAAIVLFFKSQKKPWLIVPSAFFFALTLLAYQGAKLSTALIVVALFLTHRKKILSFNKKTILIAITLAAIVSMPIIASFTNGKTGRLEVFSVFSYPRPEEYLNNFLQEGNEHKNDMNYWLFHSEQLNFARGVLGRYFNHFSSRFLLFEGDWQNKRHSAPNHGMLLLADAISLAIGIFIVAKSKKNNSKEMFLVCWLLFSPLPSALSRDQVHAVRSFNMVIPLTILSAYGVSYLTSIKPKIFATLALILFYTVSLAYFFDAYFIHMPIHDSKSWNYGYKQMVSEISKLKDDYSKINVQQSFAQPYIYFLFFQKYSPEKYQKEANLVSTGIDVGNVEKVGDINFTQTTWSVNKNEKGLLLVTDPSQIPPSEIKVDATIIKDIKYLDGNETAFYILKINEK